MDDLLELKCGPELEPRRPLLKVRYIRADLRADHRSQPEFGRACADTRANSVSFSFFELRRGADKAGVPGDHLLRLMADDGRTGSNAGGKVMTIVDVMAID